MGKIIRTFLCLLFLALGFLFFPRSAAAATKALTGQAQVLTSGKNLDFTNYYSNVTVETSTGIFSGYAFLEEEGWVAFGSTDNSEGPVHLNLTTGAVTGKAKVLTTGAYLDFDSYNSNVTASIPGGVFSGYVFSTELGWVNFGDPGVSAGSQFDVTAPVVSLTAVSPDPTTNNKPTITGTVTDDLGTVSTLSFQVDSVAGDWLACTADDGTFDEAAEAFSCAVTNTLADGSHTIYVRATDSNGNTTASGSETTDTFTVDTKNPTTFSLQSPENDSYTGNERPSFKWKTAEQDDATTSLTKYKLEIDNGDPPAGGGDFVVDDISPDRDTNYETEKYRIYYEGFGDTDKSNNYITVSLKDSSHWSKEENYGKLKAGKRTWRVIGYDRAGNSRQEQRTLFVDFNAPELSRLKVNQTSLEENLTGFDQRPMFGGRVVDKLEGERDDRIAAGPQSLKIKVERQDWTGLYSLYATAEIKFSQIFYTGVDKRVEDLSQNLKDKYADFSYKFTDNLPFGRYKISLVAKDGAGNESPATVFQLRLMGWTQFNELPESREFIDSLIKETGTEKEVVEKVVREQNVVLATAVQTVNFFRRFLTQAVGQLNSLYWQGVAGGKKRVEMVKKGITLFLARIPRVRLPERIELLAFKIEKPKVNLPRLEIPYMALLPKGLVSGVNGFTHKIVVLAGTFKMLFLDKEPTQIANVRVDKITAATAEISWETNHYATAKLNYGLSRSYGLEIQSEELSKKHRFVLSNLQPGKTYYFEVMNHAKNYVYDAYFEFTTAGK